MLRCAPLAGLVIASALQLLPATAQAQAQKQTQERERKPDGAIEHLYSLKLELAGLLALITYAGIRDWKWGTAHWRYVPEGWFGMNTGSGGQDKFGHAYTSYLQTEFLYLRLRTYHGENAAVTVYPALFTWLIMTYVEFFDAFSVDHGFSPEDLIMDTVGASAAFLREKFPVARAFDYRLEYYPSSWKNGYHPLLDYSGQKFLLAFRPGELLPIRSTAFGFSELYLGYYTRGFEDDGPKSSHVFVGLGVDLQRILEIPFGPSRADPGSFHDHVGTALSVFQPPYHYPALDIHERHRVP